MKSRTLDVHSSGPYCVLISSISTQYATTSVHTAVITSVNWEDPTDARYISDDVPAHHGGSDSETYVGSVNAAATIAAALTRSTLIILVPVLLYAVPTYRNSTAVQTLWKNHCMFAKSIPVSVAMLDTAYVLHDICSMLSMATDRFMSVAAARIVLVSTSPSSV